MHSLVEVFCCSSPNWVRFVFLVESNVHPINKSAFLAFFRMMSVLAYIPIHVSVGHLLYTSVSLVFPPFCSLLWPWSPVESDLPEFMYLFQVFLRCLEWLISLTLIPVLDIHSSWVCCPYTGNISSSASPGKSFLDFPSGVVLLFVLLYWCYPQYVHFVSQLESFQWIVFPLESILIPSVSPLLPQWGLQSVFWYPQLGVVSCSRILFLLLSPIRVLLESLFLVSVLLRRIFFSSVWTISPQSLCLLHAYICIMRSLRDQNLSHYCYLSPFYRVEMKISKLHFSG